MQPSDILLTDHVAIVTAGASGIGGGIALALAQFGAHVAIGDIDEAAGKAKAAEIEALGRQALFVRMDAMDTAQVQAMVEATAKKFGRIDFLINNAGGVRRSPFLELTERNWERHIALNLKSMLAATKSAVPVMIKGDRGGSIVNVTSIEGSRAAPGYSVYAACKAGMINFTRTMAVELAEHNITINALAPDHIDTPGISGPNGIRNTPPFKGPRSRYIPLGRDGVLDDIAGPAVFLCSKMSRYITGVTIGVDGGTLASSGWVRTKAGGFELYEPDL